MPRILLSLAALVTFTLASQAMAADNTSPSAPTDLTASHGTRSTVALRWSPSTDDSGVVNYHIYHNRVFIGSTRPPSSGPPQVTVFNLDSPCGSWSVTAEDAAHNVSPPSNVATVGPVCSVYSVASGVRQDYYPPDDVTALTGWGFPLQMWDDGGPDSTVNSGWVCALLATTYAWQWSCFYSDNFAGDNYISTGLGGYPKSVHLMKSNDSGTWSADWGTGGPGWTVVYYATYDL